MNKPKVTAEDFTDFLVATPVNATVMEAQRTSPVGSDESSHDACRLLHRLDPSRDAVWLEVKAEVCLTSGGLILDDTVLDKPHARKIDCVHHIWSGKHYADIKGIDLLTLLWTDGERHLLCGYRIYDKPNDGKTINNHFGDLIDTAKAYDSSQNTCFLHGFYSSLLNLRKIDTVGWRWVTRLKHNRRFYPARARNRPVGDWDIATTGTVVHLENYNMVKVFRIISKDGTAEHWATNDLEMDELGRWKIEEYHRGLKQVTNVKSCQCWKAHVQRSDIGLARTAFLVFDRYCFRTGYNWAATKAKIFQEAVRLSGQTLGSGVTWQMNNSYNCEVKNYF